MEDKATLKIKLDIIYCLDMTMLENGMKFAKEVQLEHKQYKNFIESLNKDITFISVFTVDKEILTFRREHIHSIKTSIKLITK